MIWTSVIALVISLGSFYLNQWVFSFSDDQCTWVVETDRSVDHGKKVVRKRAVIKEILPEGVAETAGLLEGDELLIVQGKKVQPDRLAEIQMLVAEGVQRGEFACPYRADATRAIITMCNGVSTWYRPEVTVTFA